MNKFDFVSQELDLKLSIVRKKTINLSLIRIVLFFALGALVILGFAESAFWWIPALFFGYLFVFFIRKYNFQKDQESIYLALQRITKEREKRQKRDLKGLDPGNEFLDKSHPFSGDLDLFGEHSLFQLMNHSISQGGRKKLAEIMKSPFSLKEIPDRIEAVQELASKGEFLEAMEAIGRAFQQEKVSNQAWLEWISKPEKANFLISILAFLGPIGGVFVLVLINLGIIPTAFLGLWILLGVGTLGVVFLPLKKASEAIPLSQTLRSFQLRAELIENEVFASKTLQFEKSKINSSKGKVSQLLVELDRLGLWVQNRLNLLYLPINLIFWTDFLLFLQLSRWKAKVGNTLSQLPEHLEQWEMWVSLGAFEFELEGKGEVSMTQERMLEVEELDHPLILPEKSISNSLTLGSAQRLILLTGANMSGKTTFMRTLGINCVLVNLGLSPFAKKVRLGDFQLFTSMRNSDNLGESVSSFYAELSRIKNLILKLEAGEPILFLLDEILKGTNTQDRIEGSKALIYQILETEGFGIISTHDVELAEMGKSVEKVHNFSFHSEVKDKTILFDYKLKKGPCPSFNAHKLMELMGIRFKEH
ncbi:MutS-related protein [Algoriphagus mannitolivorans]|uniref:MutS-related protein n=1 Tax=Algoriphagus mannitolivorans TaxID=226504 RepID=UPI0003FE3FA4|nr:hypothetical protein [Algoriphagus mannitolivorans]